MDLRPNELAQVQKLCEAICSLYPEHFQLNKYEHPVLGTRICLRINNNTEIDLNRITKITFEIDTRIIIIRVDFPNMTYFVHNFIKLDGVV